MSKITIIIGVFILTMLALTDFNAGTIKDRPVPTEGFWRYDSIPASGGSIDAISYIEANSDGYIATFSIMCDEDSYGSAATSNKRIGSVIMTFVIDGLAPSYEFWTLSKDNAGLMFEGMPVIAPLIIDKRDISFSISGQSVIDIEYNNFDESLALFKGACSAKSSKG